MALDVNGVLNALVSHALDSGLFDRVLTHEPKSPPGNGLTCAMWISRIDPVAASGLSSTSVRIVVMARIYNNMLMEPQDAIDPNIATAAASLMEEYSGDFDLGGNARDVDLLGEFGLNLSSRDGYANLSKGIYRVMEITIPVVVNDAWTQSS